MFSIARRAAGLSIANFRLPTVKSIQIAEPTQAARHRAGELPLRRQMGRFFCGAEPPAAIAVSLGLLQLVSVSALEPVTGGKLSSAFVILPNFMITGLPWLRS